MIQYEALVVLSLQRTILNPINSDFVRVFLFPYKKQRMSTRKNGTEQKCIRS